MRETECPIQKGCYTIYRTVHTTKAHPQVEYIFYEGKKRPVYVGFNGDMAGWVVARNWDDPQYLYCVKRTMPIEEDPDFIGEVEEQYG